MDEVSRVAAVIAERVRPAFGPFGQDQLVVTEGKTLVTNSAGRILALSKVGSPLAKIVVDHLLRSSTALGDGAGTLALLLDGVFEHCAALLRDGRLRRSELARCFVHIEEDLVHSELGPLLERLRWSPLARPPSRGTLVAGKYGEAERLVGGLARGFFGANFPPDVSDQLWRLCWAWLLANVACANGAEAPGTFVAAARRLRHDDLVRIPAPALAGAHASAGAAPRRGAAASEVLGGHILTGVLGHAAMPASVVEDGACAVVLDADVAPLSLRVVAPEAMHARLSEVLLISAERLWQLRVRAVFCSTEVHEEWRGALARRGIVLLHLVEEDELALLERQGGGATHRVRLATDDSQLLRRALIPFAELRPLEARGAPALAGGRALWALLPRTGAPVPHCWLVLRAPSVGLAQEYRHALLRLLRVLEPALDAYERTAATTDASAKVTSSGGEAIVGGLAFELALLRLAHSRGLCLNGAPSLAARGGGTGVCDDEGDRALRGLAAGQAQRVRCEAWRILRAGLLRVLEAFLGNAVRSGACHGTGTPPAARRYARLLAAGPGEESDAVAHSLGLGLRPLPRAGGEEAEGPPLFSFAASPGTAVPPASDAEAFDEVVPLETRFLKLGLLRAMCGLCRQLVKIDPDSLLWSPRRGGQAPRGLLGPARRKARRGEDSSSSSSSSESED